jgi:hypothetical protein
MINGKLPTWFVIKWLESHPMDRAESPDVADTWPQIVARYSKDFWVVVFTGDHWESIYRGAAPIRNDWTIYRNRSTPIRFKPKEKNNANTI